MVLCVSRTTFMKTLRIARAGKELGQYTEDQVRMYLLSGNLVPTDHAWFAGLEGWKTLAELGYSATSSAPTPPPPPPPPAPPGVAASAPSQRSRLIGGASPEGAYLRESMAGGEIMIFEAKITLIPAIVSSFILMVFTLFVLTVVMGSVKFAIIPTIMIGLLYFVLCLPSVLGIELGITNRRVIAKMGLVTRKVIEVRNDKIEGVTVNQSILGRMFDYGTIGIRGSGQTEVPIENVSDPLAFRRAVDSAISRSR